MTVEGHDPQQRLEVLQAAAPPSPRRSPVTTLPVRVCLKEDGFDPTKLYQLVYTVKDPYVLGAGTAAFRDLGSFFRYETADDFGTPNPIAGGIKKAIIRGSSQSGNFTRHLIHLGMNEDEAGRIVHEGAWPLIAGRRVANNSRWGQPDGVLELYQMGSEGPQWWHAFPDRVRDMHPGGILDRCEKTKTCPKIIETFGGAEVFALKMTTSWVGTDPKNDIPLPDNVRRYYLPSSTHGGGGGGFNEAIPATGANCPGNNWGTGTLRANPVPATQLVNRMRVALREWVLNGTEPPPSKWPLMRGPKNERTLVEATQRRWASRTASRASRARSSCRRTSSSRCSTTTGVPSTTTTTRRATRPTRRRRSGRDQDDGAEGRFRTATSWAAFRPCCATRRSARTWDGTSPPAGSRTRRSTPGRCATTSAAWCRSPRRARSASPPGDPRPSLEERYGTHDAYVAAVKAAADNAACNGYLLAGPQAAAMGAKCTGTIPPGFPDDWAVLVNQAIASNVCNQPGDGGKCNPGSAVKIQTVRRTEKGALLPGARFFLGNSRTPECCSR